MTGQKNLNGWYGTKRTMANTKLVNGRSARQMALTMENCVQKDACNTCPYDKKHGKGRSCMDYLLLDAATALRKLQKRYEKQRERYYIDKERIIQEAMLGTLYVAWLTDPEYREVRMLGVFATQKDAEAYLEERKADAITAGMPNLVFGVSKSTDRRGNGK